MDVQAAITQASRLLPAGHADAADLHQGESGRPADPVPRADFADAAAVDAGRVRRDPHRAAHLAWSRGVAQVQVLGAQKYAVHVQMDPHALASRQIGINEVETALKSWNVNLPTGTIIGPQRAFTLQASGQLDERRPVPLAGGGLPQRLAGAPGRTGRA